MPERKSLVLLVATLAACLLLVEVFSQFRYRQRSLRDFIPHSDIQFDPVLGWAGMPGMRMVDAWGHEHAINADGLRDDDWDDKLAHAAAHGSRKILLLGDSLAYGQAIDKTWRLGEQLEDLYTAHGQDAQVFNTAFPGYGPDQEYLALLRHLPRVKPDVVVLYFCQNDFGDAALPYDHREPQRRRYKPWFDREARLTLNSSVPLRFSQRVQGTPLADLYLRYFVDDLLSLLDDLRYRLHGVCENRILTDASGPFANMDHVFFDPRYEDLYQSEKQRLFLLYSRMQETCQAKGVRFVVLVNNARTTPHEREFYATLATLGIETAFTADLERTPFIHEPVNFVQGDGHPNFLRNAANAAAVYNAVEHAALPLDLYRAPWRDQLPTAIDFHRPDAARHLFGNWYDAEPIGRWFNRQGACLLRGGAPDRPARLILTFQSARGGDFTVRINDIAHTLPVPGPGLYQASLPLPPAPLYAVVFEADSFLADALSHNGDQRHLSVCVRTAAIAPAPVSHNRLVRLP